MTYINNTYHHEYHQHHRHLTHVQHRMILIIILVPIALKICLKQYFTNPFILIAMPLNRHQVHNQPMNYLHDLENKVLYRLLSLIYQRKHQ